MIVSTAVFGIPGMGKTQGLRRKVKERRERAKRDRRPAAMLLLDGPGETAEMVLADLCASGQEADVEYDELNSPDGKRICATPLRPTGNRVEDEKRVEQFLQPFLGQRGIASGPQNPLIYKYAEAGAWVMMGLPPRRIDDMLRLFTLGDPTAQWMLDNTTERAYAQMFIDASERATLPRFNPSQYEYEVGPAGRLLRPLMSPVIGDASVGGYDWKDFILSGRVHLRNGKGVKREIRRFDSIQAINGILNAGWELFNETGQPHDYYIMVEEGGADGIHTPQLLDAMRVARKTGFHLDFVAQSPADLGETFAQFIALVHRVECYRMTSGVDEMAEIFSNPTWDNQKVLQEKQVTYTAGYEEVGTESVSLDHLGNRRVTKGVSHRPIPGIRVDQVLYDTSRHKADWKRILTTLNVGQRLVGDGDGVRIETVEMLPEPWPLGLTPLRTKKAVERIRSRSIYTRTEPWKPSTPSETPPPLERNVPSSPPSSTPGPTPPPTTSRGGRGMERS